MRLKFAPVALFTLSVAFGSLSSLTSGGSAWAKGGKASGEKDGEVPDAVSRQFKWEEGVVGTNDKKLDRKKIAAMQEAARKEDAKHKNEPTVKKAERPAGVGVPSSSTLPTMDIEKPAPVAARTPKPHPVVEKAPKPRDSLDALLDSESKDSGPHRKSDGGLGKILAVGGDSSSAPASASAAQDTPAAKAKSKRAARRGH